MAEQRRKRRLIRCPQGTERRCPPRRHVTSERRSREFFGVKNKQSQITSSKKTQSAKQTRKTLRELEAARWADTLELDSGKPDDEVRHFLYENGVRLKTVWSVIKNVRRTLQIMGDRYGGGRSLEGRIEGRKHKETGQTIYKIPKFVLEAVVECKKELRREQKLKWWHSPKSRKKRGEKSVKKILKKSSVESAAR
jgi:hypothetical protein